METPAARPCCGLASAGLACTDPLNFGHLVGAFLASKSGCTPLGLVFGGVLAAGASPMATTAARPCCGLASAGLACTDPPNFGHLVGASLASKSD